MSRRIIKVFLASPGDLARERRSFREVIEQLNTGFGDGAGVRFVALGWEDTLASTGRRSQSVINREVDSCDVFLLALYRRWGQSAPDSPFGSYSEEEFHRALERFRKTGIPEVFVFFREVDPESLADPGPQLTQILKFRRGLERSREVLYRYFSDVEGFGWEVDRHLRAFAKGELPAIERAASAIVLPVEMLERVEKAEAQAQAQAEKAAAAQQQAEEATAVADKLALCLARRAAEAAKQGRPEEARQDFALALSGASRVEVLHLAGEFYWRTGELDVAEEQFRRALAMSGPEEMSLDTADAYRHLGAIEDIRGSFDVAESLWQKALKIYKELGHSEGQARVYGNLGVIATQRGALAKGKEFQRRALALNRRLGRLDGQAITYGNLGVISGQLGELDEAARLQSKALELYEGLGHIEGQARAKLGLGKLAHSRGERTRAHQLLQESLSLYRRCSSLEGQACLKANLGIMAQDEGELEKAESFFRQALEIYRRLGNTLYAQDLQKRIEGLGTGSLGIGPGAKTSRSGLA